MGDPNSTKGLISTMSKKWKLEYIKISIIYFYYHIIYKFIFLK
jgi:hypothetical protein